MRIPNPINGVYTKSASLDTPPAYTQYANNVRPVDTQNNQIRIGQRPGLAKVNTNQLGSTGQPIVAICVVAVAENVES
jgi:hypothetical protein